MNDIYIKKTILKTFRRVVMKPIIPQFDEGF